MSTHINSVDDIVERIEDRFDDVERSVENLQALKDELEDDISGVEWLLRDLESWKDDAETKVLELADEISDEKQELVP